MQEVAPKLDLDAELAEEIAAAAHGPSTLDLLSNLRLSFESRRRLARQLLTEDRGRRTRSTPENARLNHDMRRRLAARFRLRSLSEPRVSVRRKVPLDECRRRVRANT